MHTVPIRNEKLVVIPSERSREAVVVEVELRYSGPIGLLARWVRARRRKRYELAGLSREMFEMVDGERSVEALIGWLCERDNLTFLEGRALVLQYLRDLMRRGLIVVAAA